MVLLPGAGVIYTVSTGLFEGWRASIAAAFGCTAGIVPHLVVSSLGLSTLLHTSALAFQVIRLLGTAYLLSLIHISEPTRPERIGGGGGGV